MNLRLPDGTVRCSDHFDASSYQGVTDDPCLYCGSTPEPVAVPVQVTTWTIMSTSIPGRGTVSTTSKVRESVSSAVDHLIAMGKGLPEPSYDVRSGGWRWTWETLLPGGIVNTETVRIY